LGKSHFGVLAVVGGAGPLGGTEGGRGGGGLLRRDQISWSQR